MCVCTYACIYFLMLLTCYILAIKFCVFFIYMALCFPHCNFNYYIIIIVLENYINNLFLDFLFFLLFLCIID